MSLLSLRAAPQADELRHVLGHFVTGVVVITATSDDRPVGVACNSFTSASMEPPMVAFFVSRSSETWPHLYRAGHFIANILGGHQGELSRAFATKGVDRFAGVSWSPALSGAPRIDDAIAWIECDIDEVVPAGDHWLVLGAVRTVTATGSDDPLAFFRGGYHRLSSSSGAGREWR